MSIPGKDIGYSVTVLIFDGKSTEFRHWQTSLRGKLCIALISQKGKRKKRKQRRF